MSNRVLRNYLVLSRPDKSNRRNLLLYSNEEQKNKLDDKSQVSYRYAIDIRSKMDSYSEPTSRLKGKV
jgi:hypothetical protein